MPNNSVFGELRFNSVRGRSRVRWLTLSPHSREVLAWRLPVISGCASWVSSSGLRFPPLQVGLTHDSNLPVAANASGNAGLFLCVAPHLTRPHRPHLQ